jgi:hypothetical protein
MFTERSGRRNYEVKNQGCDLLLQVYLLTPKGAGVRQDAMKNLTPNLRVLILAFMVTGGHFLAAIPKDATPIEEKPSAIEAGKEHLRQFLSADFEGLKKSFAPVVTLMPGHEFLKPKYGFAKDPKRSVATKVKREELIDLFIKKMDGRAKPPKEKVDEKIKVLKFENLPIEVGDFATDPSDKVATPDGKLHFETREGDVVFKVSPPRGGFILLHLRLVDKQWRLVSQYLD